MSKHLPHGTIRISVKTSLAGLSYKEQSTYLRSKSETVHCHDIGGVTKQATLELQFPFLFLLSVQVALSIVQSPTKPLLPCSHLSVCDSIRKQATFLKNSILVIAHISFCQQVANLHGKGSNMCYQLVERYAACKCLYFRHAVDPCERYGQRGHTVQERIVLVGYACPSHSSRHNGHDSSRDSRWTRSSCSNVKGACW